MGLLQWMRGGDDADSSVTGMSAGLAELEAVFAPSKRKQTELIEEQAQARIDVSTGEPLDQIDLDNGVAVVHRRPSTSEVSVDITEDGLGDELDRDSGQEETADTREDLDPTPLDKSHNH